MAATDVYLCVGPRCPLPPPRLPAGLKLSERPLTPCHRLDRCRRRCRLLRRPERLKHIVHVTLKHSGDESLSVTETRIDPVNVFISHRVSGLLLLPDQLSILQGNLLLLLLLLLHS